MSIEQSTEQLGLRIMRRTIAAHGSALGLSEERAEDLVMVVHELATNAIRHGGGRGRFRLWRKGDRVFCEVSDDGPGMRDPESAGLVRAEVGSTGGRGLWLVRQICHEVTIKTSAKGTAVLIALLVHGMMGVDPGSGAG